jgi:hypothetical protein
MCHGFTCLVSTLAQLICQTGHHKVSLHFWSTLYDTSLELDMMCSHALYVGMVELHNSVSNLSHMEFVNMGNRNGIEWLGVDGSFKFILCRCHCRVLVYVFIRQSTNVNMDRLWFCCSSLKVVQ